MSLRPTEGVAVVVAVMGLIENNKTVFPTLSCRSAPSTDGGDCED